MPAKTAATRHPPQIVLGNRGLIGNVDVTLVVGDLMHYGLALVVEAELSKPLSERTVALSVNGKLLLHLACQLTVWYHHDHRLPHEERQVHEIRSRESSSVPEIHHGMDGERHGVVLRGSGKSKNNAPRLVAVRFLPQFSDGSTGYPVVISFEPRHSAAPGAVVRVSRQISQIPKRPGCCSKPKRPISIQYGIDGVLRSYGSSSRTPAWLKLIIFLVFCLFVLLISILEMNRKRNWQHILTPMIYDTDMM